MNRAQFLRLAMADGAQPHIVTVCFGYEDGKVYFHCAAEGRKLDVIRANPRVAFMVDVDTELVLGGQACGSTVKYRSVIGSGSATIVADGDEKLRGLDALMKQYGVEPGGYAAKSLEKTAVVRIDVEEMAGKQSGRE